ncbi:glycosyltransferase family 2 protein [Mucisphaera sp.]|uniref:glycosyltransferase family 2 protein n=1 Tax=Mucisphaera sp. TaxID=2913024 RepID=UPI003D0F208F
MARISVTICCANAADTLADACASAKWADELVIVDSGSQDNTQAIAEAHADVYVQEPWRGYVEQKKFGMTLARNDWVFILDHDEEIDERLAAAIQEMSEEELDRYDVLHCRRKNYIYGRHARGWDPDWQSRLIHRGRARWNDDALHDDRLPTTPDRQKKLTGALLHKRTSSVGFEDYFSGRRLDARLLMVAEQQYAKGKRCSSLDLMLRPGFTLFKQLILKGAILDGTFGLMVAQKTAVTTQLKYAALWAVQHGVHRNETSKQG